VLLNENWEVVVGAVDFTAVPNGAAVKEFAVSFAPNENKLDWLGCDTGRKELNGTVVLAGVTLNKLLAVDCAAFVPPFTLLRVLGCVATEPNIGVNVGGPEAVVACTVLPNAKAAVGLLTSACD